MRWCFLIYFVLKQCLLSCRVELQLICYCSTGKCYKLTLPLIWLFLFVSKYIQSTSIHNLFQRPKWVSIENLMNSSSPLEIIIQTKDLTYICMKWENHLGLWKRLWTYYILQRKKILWTPWRKIIYIGPYYESTWPKIWINCKLLIKVSNLEFVKKKIYHNFEAPMPGNRQYMWPLIKALFLVYKKSLKSMKQRNICKWYCNSNWLLPAHRHNHAHWPNLVHILICFGVVNV